MSQQPLLEVKDLKMHYPVKSNGVISRTVGHVKAVDGISFTIQPGQVLGLVGESGSGKTTTGRLVTRLERPTSGQILFEGQDIAQASERAIRPIRRDIQMIFQDPYTSLNPRLTIGQIVGAPLEIHNLVPRNQRLKRVQELLELVGL
ncbi:MAG: ATP-binding cassette domain-containing protein, partial [Agromyces sp.]